MPTYSITAPNGRTLDVTGDRMPTESELKDIFAKAGVETQPAQSDSGALGTAAAGASVAPAATLAAEVATNPGVPRTVAAVGRVSGAVEGALKGGPLAIGPGSWAGGKAGWFTGKAAQSAAAPVANLLDAARPYAQALSTASGAQGALDLAQMADPTRKDIGTLGVTLGDAHDPTHPALLNAIAMKATDGIKYLIAQGMSLGEASRAYWNAKAKAAN